MPYQSQLGDHETTLKGERLILLPERAIFWPRLDALLVADTHWGKDAAFRVAAIAVPGGTIQDDLARLGQALERTAAQRLIILGDLFHARSGCTPQILDTIGQTITHWRDYCPKLEIQLIRGNHDARAGDPPPEWNFACVDAPLLMPPFTLQHIPDFSVSKGYALAGHVHPGARLTGRGRQQMVLPCFWFGKRVGVLPAFGSFTGLEVVTPKLRDEVCVIADDSVICVSA